MPARIGEQVAAVLAAHGAADDVIAAEVEQMRTWRIAPTASRSIVGVMNEFTFFADTWRDQPGPNLLDLTIRLAETPLGPLHHRHVFPDRELAALLQTLHP
jgi:hypothetical protein